MSPPGRQEVGPALPEDGAVLVVGVSLQSANGFEGTGGEWRGD